MFSLPSGFLASTTQIMGQIFSDLKEPIILGFGLAIGFWVITKVISLIYEGVRK